MARSNLAGANIYLENILSPGVINKRNQKVKISQMANKDLRSSLTYGDVVSVQTVPRMFGNVGGTAGGTIATNRPPINAGQLTINHVYQNGAVVKRLEEVQSNLSLGSDFTSEFVDASALSEDQHVASFVTQADVNNKINDKAPVTLASTNTYRQFVNLASALKRNNAFKNPAVFINPEIEGWLMLEGILNSSNMGLEKRLNGEVGQLSGMRVITTNDLPHVRTITTTAATVATNTFSLPGQAQDTTGKEGYVLNDVTFTFTAAASAAAAGDIALGATDAITRQNIVDAINGTGTPGASTYIEIAAADRTSLKNAFVQISAYDAANKATITGFGGTFNLTFPITTQTFGGSDGISTTDASLMFALDNKVIDIVTQFDEMKVEPSPDGFSYKILHEAVSGGAVIGENAKGLATAEVFARL